jgi:hypothetical protein
MTNPFHAQVSRVGRYLDEHRRGTFVAFVLYCLIVSTGVLGEFGGEPTHAGFTTYLFLGFSAYAATMVWLGKAWPPEVRTYGRWMSAAVPVLFACVAVITNAPSFIMWVGVALSIYLGAWIAFGRAT